MLVEQYCEPITLHVNSDNFVESAERCREREPRTTTGQEVVSRSFRGLSRTQKTKLSIHAIS